MQTCLSYQVQPYNDIVITADEQGEQEKAKAEALIAADPQFPGIETVHIELGEDNTGEPSMWLVFKLYPSLQADEKWIEGFTEYSTRLSLKLIHSGLTRFPYTRFESAA